MSLILKNEFCISNGCKTLTFTETTGVQSISNPGGYGGINPPSSNFDTAILTITTPDLIEHVIDLYPTGYLPSSFNYSYEIPLSALGNPTNIVDGYWIFEYKITGLNEESEPIEYVLTTHKLFFCNSECCVYNMLQKVEPCDCCKNQSDIDTYLKASVFLDSLKNAAKCGDVTNFNNIKKIVDKLCKNVNCNSCK